MKDATQITGRFRRGQQRRISPARRDSLALMFSQRTLTRPIPALKKDEEAWIDEQYAAMDMEMENKGIDILDLID